MTRVVYTESAELDLKALIPDHRNKVSEWEASVQPLAVPASGYQTSQVGPVKVWFLVDNKVIRVTDLRVTA